MGGVHICMPASNPAPQSNGAYSDVGGLHRLQTSTMLERWLARVQYTRGTIFAGISLPRVPAPDTFTQIAEQVWPQLEYHLIIEDE